MIMKTLQYTYRGRHKTQLRSSHNHILVTYSLWTCPHNDTYNYPVVGQSVPLALHIESSSSVHCLAQGSLPRINALPRANFEGCKITTSRQCWSNKSVQSHSGLREVPTRILHHLWRNGGVYASVMGKFTKRWSTRNQLKVQVQKFIIISLDDCSLKLFLIDFQSPTEANWIYQDDYITRWYAPGVKRALWQYD